MKIIDILNSGSRSLSFEVFPPKTGETYDKMKYVSYKIAELHPSFMSVTYGAGGGTSQYTVDIAKGIKSVGENVIAHLTCVSSTREHVRNMLNAYQECGIENILALRGDIPEGFNYDEMQYRYASELIYEIKDHGGDFCIGGACYPEKHPEAASSREDIQNLKTKVDAGCEFLTTQMFFDNDVYYNFLYRLREAGVEVPVIAGIMPITHPSQIGKVLDISKTALPQRFLRIVDTFGDSPQTMRQAGIAFATEQIIDLFANGVKAVHVYSMNKPDVAAEIQANVSAIIGK